MLKNNKQREEYFRSIENWDILGSICVLNPGMTHSSDLIIVKKLKNYSIICVSANRSNEYFGEHEVKLGYYESDGDMLDNIYNLTVNQCIDIMRRKDLEEAK